MICNLCSSRGKTWSGSNPRCAFTENKTFNDNNWNCATLNALREAEFADRELYMYYDDHTTKIICVGGVTLYLQYYKNRGTVEAAWIIDGYDVRHPTLTACENILKEK